MSDIAYSIVIPVYGSGAWLDELVERIGAAMQPLDGDFELILVNDASPDATTWPAIERNAAQHPWVRGFDLVFNVGQSRTLLCGMDQCRGRYVITMDDDLQHPPEELPTLVDAMRQQPEMDCIIGAYETKRHSLLRNLGSSLMIFLNRHIYGRPKDLEMTSLRIIKRDVARALTLTRSARPLIGPMLLSTTRRIGNVSVRHQPRPHGQSGYTMRQMVSMTVNNIINGSVAPLRFFSVLGFVVAGLSFCLGAYFVVRKLVVGISTPGFTSLIVTVSFFSGMILLGMGILGEYIARIIREVTGKPRFLVRTTAQADEERHD